MFQRLSLVGEIGAPTQRHPVLRAYRQGPPVRDTHVASGR